MCAWLEPTPEVWEGWGGGIQCIIRGTNVCIWKRAPKGDREGEWEGTADGVCVLLKFRAALQSTSIYTCHNIKSPSSILAIAHSVRWQTRFTDHFLIKIKFILSMCLVFSLTQPSISFPVNLCRSRAQSTFQSSFAARSLQWSQLSLITIPDTRY